MGSKAARRRSGMADMIRGAELQLTELFSLLFGS